MIIKNTKKTLYSTFPLSHPQILKRMLQRLSRHSIKALTSTQYAFNISKCSVTKDTKGLQDNQTKIEQNAPSGGSFKLNTKPKVVHHFNCDEQTHQRYYLYMIIYRM